MIPWSHASVKELADGEPMCAGYTCRLPEVLEIARARMHWEKGAIVSFCRGQEPSEQLLVGIELLEHAVSDLRAWEQEQKS